MNRTAAERLAIEKAMRSGGPRTMFSGLSLSHKVALIPGLTLLLMGLMLAVATRMGERNTAALQALDRGVFEPLNRARTVKDEITLLHTRLFALLSIGNNESNPGAQKSNAEGLVARLGVLARNFNEFLDVPEAVPAESAARLREEFAAWSTRVRDTAGFAAYDTSYGALLAGITDDQFSRLRADLDVLVDALRQRRETLTSESIDDSLRARRMLLALSVGAAFLALLGSLLVGRGVSHPVLSLTVRMNQLAQGNTDDGVPGTERRDEVGAMARAVEVFKQNALRNLALTIEKREAEEMRARATAESQAKSSFLAMMSHEIRTPLNGVLGLAGSLMDTQLTQVQRKFVDTIRESGDTLLLILNDILDFSKLDANQMQLEASPFSPATLTGNPVSLLGPRAIAKGLKIDAIIDGDLPAALLGDSGRIRQVLLNLVSNAVKFTERGSVTLRAACTGRDDEGATIVWTVSDTGIGIAANQIDGLFGEFFQADASITRRFGGSGLGLAISKKLVTVMGGTIAVESREGQGSCFRITLRLPWAKNMPAPELPRTGVLAAFRARLDALGRPARVLIAEDNATNQLVAVQLLRGFDLQIDVVGDGLEAVQAASNFPYDVICMDMRMPEMDGLAATRAIRASGGRLAFVPIIALTANAFPEDVALCIESGMNDFVAKPVNKESLIAALLSALERLASHPGQSDIAAANTEPAIPIPDGNAGRGPPLDHSAFAELLRDIGDDGAAELVTLFDVESRARLARIDGGILDRATLTRELHTAKGASATVCAVWLSRRAAELETRLKRGDDLTDSDIAGLREAHDAWRGELAILMGPPAGQERRLLMSN